MNLENQDTVGMAVMGSEGHPVCQDSRVFPGFPVQPANPVTVTLHLVIWAPGLPTSPRKTLIWRAQEETKSVLMGPQGRVDPDSDSSVRSTKTFPSQNRSKQYHQTAQWVKSVLCQYMEAQTIGQCSQRNVPKKVLHKSWCHNRKQQGSSCIEIKEGRYCTSL